MRKHPRLINRTQVSLKLDDKVELQQVWTQDISKGGLFVESTESPELRTVLQVDLELPEGAVSLPAEVVHVLEPQEAEKYGAEPGFGLQFSSIDPEKRKRIEAYIQGLTDSLEEELEPCVLSVDLNDVISEAHQFLKGFEEEDVYTALGVEPNDTTELISAQIERFRRHFSRARPGTPAQKVRLEHARHLLRKVEVLLLSPENRFDYDLRHGLLDVEARVNTATPEELEKLRLLWHRYYPSMLDQAKHCASLAVQSQSSLDFESAIQQGQEALQYDPFNTDLRSAISDWSRRLQQRIR